MTPLQIRMMLHYYAIAEPYSSRDERHANSPAVGSQRQDLVDWGLIEPDLSPGSGYRTTPRGTAYVEALCAMPMPVQKWVMPSAA